MDTLLLGRYQLDAEIGRGGMGVIYRAHDIVLDRDVALKLLGSTALGTQGRVRLLNEARAVARLNHPNIVAVYDAGESEGAPFIVMELVQGQSLHDKPPRDLDEIVSIAAQVCAALAHAHAHGIIHRDLKPENVLITPDGIAKLTDFGLARSVASRLSEEGTISGTVFYLAPELALGQPFDGRADLYALGVVLYELTTGHLPFTADDPLAIISQHLYAPVVPPRALNPAIPPALEALIVQLMSKQATDRPASAAEVRERLECLDATAHPTISEPPALLDRIARGRFVARQRELASAHAEWQQARRGEGRVLLISGEPGIGKTRFVRELLAQVRISGGKVLSGECYPEGAAPYEPVGQGIEAAFEGPGADSYGLADPILADLVTLAPNLRARFPNIPPNPPQDPQAEQQRVFESVVALCTALAARSPLALFLDDAHWGDSATLALLRHLARRTRKLPLLIVATYREVDLDQSRPWNQVLLDLNRERLATRIKLTRLSCDDTCSLLNALFQEPVSSELLDAIYCETEGNPFFIEEVVKALVEEGKVVFQDGRWQQPNMAEIEIPQSVRLAIQARLANLSEPVQETLRLAAVLGREFDFDTLKQASDLDEDALISALETAQRAQLVQEEHENGNDSYTFVHALIRLTLWESISSPRRKRLHRRVAAAVAAIHPRDFEHIAGHYRLAGDAPQARDYYLRAGERALCVYANEEAEKYYRFVLELEPTEAERSQALAGLGEALAPRGQFDAALNAWAEAIALARAAADYEQVAHLYTRSSRVAWLAGEVSRGLSLGREGIAAVAGSPENPSLAALIHETARACYFNGLAEEGQALAQQALDMARRLGAVRVEAESLITLGIILEGENRYAEVQEHFQRAVALAEENGLYYTGARAFYNLAGLLMGMARFVEAREQARRGLELLVCTGDISFQGYMVGLLYTCSTVLGDGPEVDRSVERLRELHAMIGANPGWDLFVHQVEIGYLLYQGRHVEVLSRLADFMAEAERSDDLQSVSAAANLVAETLFEARRYEQALEPASKSLSIVRQLGAGVDEHCRLAAIKARLGQVQEAHQLLAEAKANTQGRPIEMDLVSLCCGRARVAAAEKDYQTAFAAYRDLIDMAVQFQMRQPHARMLFEQGRVYLERGEPGDREQGHACMRESIGLVEKLGSPGLVQWFTHQMESA